MFLFQTKIKIKEEEWDSEIKKMKISNEAKELLSRFIKGEGEWKRRTTLNFYFRTEMAATNFVVAMANLDQYFKSTYGVEITTTGIGAIEKTKDGYEVVIYKTKAEGKIAGVPTPTQQAVQTGAVPTGELEPSEIPGKAKVAPTATISDIEKRAQELRESGYQSVEILDSEEEARKKLGEFPKGSEAVFEKYTIGSEVDDALQAQIIEVYVKEVPTIIHYYGYYFTPNTGYYSIPRDKKGHGTDEGSLNIRRYAGNVGGTTAYIYGAHENFMRVRASTAKKYYSKKPLDLAAYLCRGYTGVIHKKIDENGKVIYDEQRTINMHRTNIQTFVNTYRTFEGIRGTLPDDLWVSLRAFSYVQADNAVALGIIDAKRRDEYADAFAFGMLSQIWHESALPLTEFFPWLREETGMVIDPDKVITTIMNKRDKYRLFYGDEEITDIKTVKASPYKDLLITMPDGKTPLAHLRISHPKWLYDKRAWDGNKDHGHLIQSGVFLTSVAKWSWYGFGGTAFYHPLETEIYFSLIQSGVEDKYLIGYKPIEEKPTEVVNAFSVVGDREARIVGTTFQTNGRIIAYGNKTINDLKNDDDFSLDYIGFAPAKAKQEIWLPGLRGKKERYVAYLLIPKGDPLKDRLPPGIDNCEKDIQNGALVYEDYRYDLILTINGKKMNISQDYGYSIPKYIIDKGLKPENLYYEINPNNTLDIAVFFDENGNLIKDPLKHTGPKYAEVIATGIKLSEADVRAIEGKPISQFASFEDNGRTGLDLYAVVRINEDNTRTLVDAARIADHEFDYKFLYENRYAKILIGSLDSSRVVVSDAGERSYHIMPTDIQGDWRSLFVGTIPRELITASPDGKVGTFENVSFYKSVMVKGIKGAYVNYYLNYENKPSVSFEFAGLPVSIETLTSKDSKTRKAAIAKLLSLSQNPISIQEASNYMGLISEVEAKWKDVLDEEDRKNLAEARANFERYSGMVRAGEVAAGVSERTPTEPPSWYPPTITEATAPFGTSEIPTFLVEEKLRDKLPDIGHNANQGMLRYIDALSRNRPEEERRKAAQPYIRAMMNDLGLPNGSNYDHAGNKEDIKYRLFGDKYADVSDDNIKALLDALYNGDIENFFELMKKINDGNYYDFSPVIGLLRKGANIPLYLPAGMVTATVGGAVLEFESEGYKKGALGAPKGGLVIGFLAYLDFINEAYKKRVINVRVNEEGEFEYTVNESMLRQYGIEPSVGVDLTWLSPNKITSYVKGKIGLRYIFDDKGRLQTTYGTPELAVGVGGFRINNILLGVEGKVDKLVTGPPGVGGATRVTVAGNASTIIAHLPVTIKAGGEFVQQETRIITDDATQKRFSWTKAAFGVISVRLVEVKDEQGNVKFALEPSVGAKWERIGKPTEAGGGVGMQMGPFNTQLNLWKELRQGSIPYLGFRVGVSF